jgi:hypothetical protein
MLYNCAGIDAGKRATIDSGNHAEALMSDQELMKYFGFDDSDLQANRDGRISAKQQALISKGEKSRLFNFVRAKYKLARVQGPVKIDSWQTAYHGGMLWYALEVGEKSFHVDQELPKLMAQGDVYAIYYCYAEDAPDDNGLYKILSAELVSKAK